MCDAMSGWRRRILSGGMEPVEVTDTPPEGFVRLPPAQPQVAGDHSAHAGPPASVVLLLVALAAAGLAILHTLMPAGLGRVVFQAAGVLVMFCGLGIGARLDRSHATAEERCACEPPPVWMRVVPSIAEPRRSPVEDRSLMKPTQVDLKESLVGAGQVRRSRPGSPHPARHREIIHLAGLTGRTEGGDINHG